MVGRQLGFAFGVNLAIARAGSYAADMSPTLAPRFYELGWQPPLFLAAGLMAFSVIAAAIYYFMELSAEKRYTLTAPTQSDRIVWSDLLKFDRSFWCVIGLCVTF